MHQSVPNLQTYPTEGYEADQPQPVYDNIAQDVWQQQQYQQQNIQQQTWQPEQQQQTVHADYQDNQQLQQSNGNKQLYNSLLLVKFLFLKYKFLLKVLNF